MRVISDAAATRQRQRATIGGERRRASASVDERWRASANDDHAVDVDARARTLTLTIGWLLAQCCRTI